jgi:hypothetical protein
VGQAILDCKWWLEDHPLFAGGLTLLVVSSALTACCYVSFNKKFTRDRR